MQSNVKVTFWLNKTKKNSQNLVPVYMRVCFDYDQFSKATGINVKEQDWDKKTMKLRGSTQEVQSINCKWKVCVSERKKSNHSGISC